MDTTVSHATDKILPLAIEVKKAVHTVLDEQSALDELELSETNGTRNVPICPRHERITPPTSAHTSNTHRR